MMTQSWVVPTHIMFNVLSRCKKKHVRIFFSFGLWYTGLQLKKIYLYVRKIHVMIDVREGVQVLEQRKSEPLEVQTDFTIVAKNLQLAGFGSSLKNDRIYFVCTHAVFLFVWQTTETQLTVLQLIMIVLVLVVLVELSLSISILILVCVCSV